MRRGPGSLYRKLLSLRYLATRDRKDVARFLAVGSPSHLARRLQLVSRFVTVTNHVRGYHTLGEMLSISREILARRGPVVIEAGCGHGSSTAKLSLATELSNGRLLVFDSFRGIPENDEQHEHLDGRPVRFRKGAFRATLPAVQRTVERFGAPGVVEYRKGLFEDTLPALDTGIDVAVLDVDLLSSTRRCLLELVPRMRPGGVIVTLDGQLRATHRLLADHGFWCNDVGREPPVIDGLFRAKLITIHP